MAANTRQVAGCEPSANATPLGPRREGTVKVDGKFDVQAYGYLPLLYLATISSLLRSTYTEFHLFFLFRSPASPTMSSAADNNRSNELYCGPSSEPLPESVLHDGPPAAEGVTTKSKPPFQKALPRIRLDSSGSVVVDSRFTWVETYATPQKTPPLRVYDEWSEIDKQRTLYEAQRIDIEEESLAAEISWREKEFRRLANMCEKHVPVRFARPMDMGHIYQLADRPELLLRYFQNEYKIAEAIKRCEVQFRYMYPANANGSRNYYRAEQKFRQDVMRVSRLKLEPVAKKLFAHLQKLLCGLLCVRVANIRIDEPLSTLENAFITEVIKPNEELCTELQICWELERHIFQAQAAEEQAAAERAAAERAAAEQAAAEQAAEEQAAAERAAAEQATGAQFAFNLRDDIKFFRQAVGKQTAEAQVAEVQVAGAQVACNLMGDINDTGDNVRDDLRDYIDSLTDDPRDDVASLIDNVRDDINNLKAEMVFFGQALSNKYHTKEESDGDTVPHAINKVSKTDPDGSEFRHPEENWEY
ncbi:hypothetical protein P171DRAFT_479374 [Karstenula rhodostoma CBS 690.94]|uniref:Uncharacterized protein n=1 Tax=Karstenula rhodostoma CBS 690.94 TaxID=1392251 RepID=A0A9P4PTR3_9PLEO|nr:hypothetical protein P171DRAFT_479374 [Karstenula rhodostoma CBS 690.94]